MIWFYHILVSGWDSLDEQTLLIEGQRLYLWLSHWPMRSKLSFRSPAHWFDWFLDKELLIVSQAIVGADSIAITLKIKSTAGPARQQTKINEVFNYSNSIFTGRTFHDMEQTDMEPGTRWERSSPPPTIVSYKTDNEARVTRHTITSHIMGPCSQKRCLSS